MAEKTWQRIVAEIGAVASPGGRAHLGLCSLEGTRLFERALAAGACIEHALARAAFMEDTAARPAALREALRGAGCSVAVVSEQVLDGLTGGRDLGGIIGLARLPEKRTLAELAGSDDPAPPGERPALFVACVGFNDPGNVGAVARTAHAAGARALLSVGATDAFHPKAIRTSMGSLFHLPVIELADTEEFASCMARAGVRTLGAVTDADTSLPELAVRREPTAIVLGSEAFGLSQEEIELLDERVTIPMASNVDSLSVNAAAAALAYGLRWAQSD